MPRECHFGHPVSKGLCAYGHLRATSLKCDVTACVYVTEPVDPQCLHLAIEMLRLHMVGAHNMDKNYTKEMDENDTKEINSKEQYDPDESRTCFYYN